MDQNGLYEWLERNFVSLPRVNEAVYQAVWGKGALRFSEKSTEPDLIDALNSRLVCTVLAENIQLLILLPDYAPHRGAFLFATALLMESACRIQNNIRGGQVLYFGSTVGIREHLGELSVNRLHLDTVFPHARLQRDLQMKRVPARGGKAKQLLGATNLPNVLSIYSPGDPVLICQRNESNWIAVDCADERQLRWLKPLVEYAASHSIPLIAWVQNPFSTAIDDFKNVGGQTFLWPITNVANTIPSIQAPINSGLRQIFENNQERCIWPIVVDTSGEDVGIKELRHAYIALAKASNSQVGRLALGAMQVCWRYLRTMENLCIPLRLYETESQNYWGVNSLSRTRAVLEKYVQALSEMQSPFYSDLIEVKGHLEKAHIWFEKGYSPLWSSLVDLCVDKLVAGTARLLVFPTQSNRKLFSLGLLAYHNVTEDDLKQLHVGMTTLHDLYDLLTMASYVDTRQMQIMRVLSGLPSADLDWQYWMVGLPSPTSTSFLAPVLNQQDVRVILYPYQLASLTRRVEQWEKLLHPGLVECADSLAMLSSRERPRIDSFGMPTKLKLREAKTATVRTPVEISEEDTAAMTIWEPFELRDEAALLMNAELAYSEIGSERIYRDRQRGENEDSRGIDFVEEVWRIEFTSGEHLLLNDYDKVNVVVLNKKGVDTDERFVSSVRQGDRIVYIHGQRIQSLLGLVISRVSRNPAVNLHVKLVERWQHDFAAAFQYKVRESRTSNVPQWNLDSLFQAMQARGSRIGDIQTFRNWLNGGTLRPQDPEDLRRLAEILDMDFVREHYVRIHRAGSRLAGLHVSLSRRLNNWISHEVLGLAMGAEEQDDVIDEELGLTFQDFHDSLVVLQVQTVEKEKGLWTRDMLGELEGGNAS